MIFDKFCKERNIKKSTINGYESAITKYTYFHKMNLDDLIIEAINDENNLIPMKNRQIKQRLLDFRTYLLESDLAPNSAKTYFSKIQSIYSHFEIETPILPQVKYDKNYEVNYFDLPTKVHIRQAIELSPVLLKAIILFMASSGTAKAETLALTIKDFINATTNYNSKNNVKHILNDLENQRIIPTFYLKRIKTDKYYYTFCSPEATSYIIKYLKTRPNLKLSDKLFDITDTQLSNKFKKINDSMNWGFKGKFRFFRSHTLRKFHASNIGLSSEHIDLLQGRSKNNIHETYIKTNPKKLKELYETVVSNVEILNEETNINSQEFNIIINVFLSGKEYNIF